MPGPYLTPGVYIEEIPAGSRPIQGVGTAVAAFLGMTEDCPRDASGNALIGQPFLVTNWEQYKQLFGGFVDGAVLPLSVYGYFANGGGVCYVESLAAARAAAKPGAAAPKAALALPSRGAEGKPSLQAEAQVSDPVTVTVADASDPADDLFKLVIRGGTAEETFDNLTLNRGRDVRNAAQVVNRESKLVRLRELESAGTAAERRPAVNTYQLAAALVEAAASAITPADVKGSLDGRTGIAGLEAIEEITMVCMPDLMVWQQAGKISLADAQGIQTELFNHCEKMMDRMAILDPPGGMKVQRIKDWRQKEANYDSKYAALYYPWIVVQNPAGKGQLTIPPSGHIAGLYARVDSERGVHKAPANEVVRGAVGLELQVNNAEQSLLNPIGVNCIRAFPGRGIRVWGARTLSSDTEWTYINVRRLFNYIEESIYEGTQWVVFEPNDMDLWERVKRTITAFLTNLWRDGALFGATPEEAFYVKCDAELNPASVRDAGMLIVEVGVAPVKPAEFVVFRFKQISGGGEISE